MAELRVVSRDQWLVERQELLEQEKQFTRDRDKLSQRRRDLPWVKLSKDYIFSSENGPIKLSELFGSSTQLIVYHFMYGPEWKAGCVSCSFWADNFNGIVPHLNARDISIAVIASAPIEKISTFKKRLGWSFNFVSSENTSFNEDYAVSFGSDHKPEDQVTYNYRPTTFPADEAAGVSVFVKADDGTLYHSYSTYSRGLDILNGAYHFMDLTPKGRDEDSEGGTMSWLRHNDSY